MTTIAMVAAQIQIDLNDLECDVAIMLCAAPIDVLLRYPAL